MTSAVFRVILGESSCQRVIFPSGLPDSLTELEDAVNAEFKRITTIPLQSKFLSQLDLHYESFLKVFERRPGQQGRKLKEMMSTVVQDDIDAARELAIKGLCIYLNEDPKDLIQEYVDMEENLLQSAIEKTTMGIFVKKDTADYEAHDVGIVLEGVAVLHDLDSVAFATSMLFGLIYALNLQYPKKLRFTFEILQKLIMELDGGELSIKAQHFKSKLHQCDGPPLNDS
ncbi:uncharacterized protein LOC130410568 isoform X2 [Triplophysa dalaica]|uniref:uncharacterized protein LOC130410568 isoform X2 n=1 Tax=Triplophysa dalaica TaxID=1582913 RepID=UPI0024DFC3C3|nr:uncharacterized protein LOC130410568 isoform X2 [Triplophysa dalaica]